MARLDLRGLKLSWPHIMDEYTDLDRRKDPLARLEVDYVMDEFSRARLSVPLAVMKLRQLRVNVDRVKKLLDLN